MKCVTIEKPNTNLNSLFGQYKRLDIVHYNGDIDFPEQFNDMGFLEEENGYDLSIDTDHERSPDPLISGTVRASYDLLRLNEYLIRVNKLDFTNEYLVVTPSFFNKNIKPYIEE